MPLVRLHDHQLAAIYDACRPLTPAQRSDFLLALSDELNRMPVDTIGPGTVHRLIVDVQRAFWTAPDLARGAGSPRSRAY